MYTTMVAMTSKMPIFWVDCWKAPAVPWKLPLIVGDPPFENLAKGGGPDHDPATAILFDLTFAGDKNASPKYATATVDVTQSGRTGQIVTHKAFTNFVFGADGIQHKVFLIENGTCMPIVVDVRANKTAKNVKLDFQCKE